MSEFHCRVCSADALERIDNYARLVRVTSDCKPWPAGGTLTVCGVCGAAQKLPDAAWFDEIDRIYKAYEIYLLSGGLEQVIFDASGGSQPRSHALVDFVVRNAKPGPKGALIDIGCGNGAALVNLSRALPGWTMSGTELSDAPLETLQALPNFGTFYQDEPRAIRERFDIVTMIHALEHMPDPLHTLIEVTALLNPGGHLFMEVPNVETSPFDLLIADHLMHFSPAHLGFLAQRAGLKVAALHDDVLPKEVTMLAGRGEGGRPRPSAERNAEIVVRHVGWLTRLLDAAREAAAKARSFGIFGTSISGMWLYGALGKEVAFFVDEDKTRIGNTYEGKPIFAPAEIPDGATVFLPLHPGTASNIQARLHSACRGRFVEPPSLDAAA